MAPPPILVLLPGMDGTGDLFAPLLAALEGRFQTIVVQYPQSDALDYAQLLPYVRASLPDGRPFVLVAESFSGPLAISLASERPEGLRGLVLCASFARNPRAALTWASRFLRALPLSRGARRMAVLVALGRWDDPALRARLDRTVARIPPAVLRTRLRAVLHVDVTPELARVSVPILYLQASNDLAVPPSAAAMIRLARAEMRCVRIEGPHFLFQANPTASATEIANFAISVAGD